MTPIQRRILIFAIMLSCMMQMIDTTIAIVALPHMQGSMSSTPDQIAWVLTSYLVATAVAIPTSAYVSQRFGRKNVLLFIIAGFAISSMLCGAAQSIGQVVLFRLLQGAFGAYFMPIAQTIILDYYSLEERPKMISIWSATTMVGPIIGPVLGGYLTDTLSWRWVFYINLPVGLLAFLCVWLVPLETKRDAETGFRWQGYIYLAIAIAATQLMLDRGNLKDWFSSVEIRVEALIAAIAFYLYMTHSLTSRNPFLNFEIFKNRNLSVTLSILFIGGALLYATLSLMPPFLQTLMHYPVFTTGLLLAPRGLSFVVALLIYSRYANRVDARLFLGVGIIISTISLWQMQQFDLNVGEGDIIWSGIVQGFGLGFFMGPIPILAFATLPKHFQGEAAALFSLVRNLGSSIGISLVTALIARWVQKNHASLTEHVTLMNPLYRPESFPPGFGLNSDFGRALMDMEILKQAHTIAYLNDFRLLMWLNGLCIVSVFFLRFKQPESVAEPKAVPQAVE